MKNSQSKFSNKKPGYESDSKSSSAGGCCCGSKISEEVDEVEITESEK